MHDPIVLLLISSWTAGRGLPREEYRRCRELLTPRAVVYVECHHDPRRKTKYSLIAVRKGSLLINMDSQAPNKVVAEWLASGELLPGLTLLKPECRYGTSRFDFYVETHSRSYLLK